MIATVTDLVSILRGDSTNVFGDPVEANTVVATGVPFAIVEQARNTTKYATDHQKTLITYTGRCNAVVDVRQGDRLQTGAGVIYLVTAASLVRNIMTGNDIRCDLDRVQQTTEA